MNIQDWLPLGFFFSFWSSCKGDLLWGTLKNLLQQHNLKASILWCSAFFYSPHLTPTHDYWKNHSFDHKDHCQKSDGFAFHKLCHSFHSKEQASFNFMTAVPVPSKFGAQKIKSVTSSNFSPSIFHEAMGLDAITLVFWMFSFKPALSVYTFTLIKRLFNSSLLYAIRVLSTA